MPQYIILHLQCHQDEHHIHHPKFLKVFKYLHSLVSLFLPMINLINNLINFQEFIFLLSYLKALLQAFFHPHLFHFPFL